MPPTNRRRVNTTASSRSSQATLSFGSKSRITKPSATAPAKKSKDLNTVTTVVPENTSHDAASRLQDSPIIPFEPHVAEVVVRDQAETEMQKLLSEEDKRAMNMTEQDLRHYWSKEEDKRRGPRGGYWADYWDFGPS
ncbi:hypothetical protein EYZ11_001853 [Aspergillus tanneri]|uniref:Uncharacterized protein n=1 Tax=Aspergillus tanneri TaxID=1220188 RepID=A0A4S3JSY5_9EURO|nr:hypothetical protein EYZ11_001853 [Aspergillus tanneri]